MIILHTCWRDERLFVWGEQEALAKGRRAVVSKAGAGRSPFDTGEGVLVALLKTLLWGGAGGQQVMLSTMLLPTVQTGHGERPRPSHPFLCAEEDKEEGSASLHPWQVTGVDLSWKMAFTLLGRCQEKRLDDGVFAGEDLIAFSELFRYAGALVARGHFLPALRKVSESVYDACWCPVIDNAEKLRVRSLASRLPPSAAGGQDRRRVAQAFLEEMVDRLVRLSVVTTLSRAHAEHGKPYSVHDAWFSALRGEARAVRWEALGELETLRKNLQQWRLPVEGGRTNDATLLFQLNEPASPDKPWFLQVGVTEGEKTRAPHKLGERLLRSLGQATMLYRPLVHAEPQASGGLGCHLNTQEAHAFLTTSAALLEASGYGIRLPSWWRTGTTHALSLQADARPHQAASEGLHALDEKVDVTWSVMLHGEKMTPEELRLLLEPQTPLVFFRGQWIQVDVRQIQDALRVWHRKTGDTHSAFDVVRLALGAGGGRYGMDVAQVHGGGWLDPFLKRLCGEQPFEVLRTPEAFCGELRPYQVRGFSWLVFLRMWGFGACLADDMGLGKTIQALAFLLHEKERGEKRPVLLVGPMSVLGNWLREAQRFAPSLRCLLHHGSGRRHGKSFVREARQVDVVVTSYHLLYRDYVDVRTVSWAGILLDEAQNIKNPDTRQAQAARALPADYRIALTGTPMENHVGDIWSLMDFLNPGMLEKRTVFREKYYRPIQAGIDPNARERLRRITTPFILRRLKTDKQIISDLPEKVEGKVYCSLTLEQARLYEEVLAEFKREVELCESGSRRGLILAVLTRLKQVCNHPAHFLSQTQRLAKRSGKLVRLEEMLEETFARGESALVFTQYAAMGTLLKRHLCQVFARDMPFLYGGVPRKERDRLVQEFQESDQPLAFVLSLKAGGTGLNLTRATHVFHYDRWWNPAVENQATDRAFRIGQTKNVMVHKLICGGTLEDRIDAMIESKTALASAIVMSGETFLTELSNTELSEILSLSETAVADENEEFDPAREPGCIQVEANRRQEGCDE
ncbi:MAG: DEAD/DEAH box helicase [bacterium]